MGRRKQHNLALPNKKTAAALAIIYNQQLIFVFSGRLDNNLIGFLLSKVNSYQGAKTYLIFNIRHAKDDGFLMGSFWEVWKLCSRRNRSVYYKCFLILSVCYCALDIPWARETSYSDKSLINLCMSMGHRGQIVPTMNSIHFRKPESVSFIADSVVPNSVLMLTK